MKSRWVQSTLLASVVAAMLSASPAAVADGKKLFEGICKACHTIGGGKRIGPDLAGATKRHTKAWLQRFIKSSQTVIKSGDPAAVKLFAQFNKMIMPDAPYTPAQISDVIEYIASGGTQAAPAAPLRAATPAEIAIGRELFQGKRRLANGGPACNSCHHVKNDAVIGGGVLAKDLTTVFTRLGGGSGVASIIGKPPFPVMSAAYKDVALKRDEIIALVGFLKDADSKHAFQQPRDYGARLALSGVGVFVGLLLLYGLIWLRRKKRSVNHDIYERQISSS